MSRGQCLFRAPPFHRQTPRRLLERRGRHPDQCVELTREVGPVTKLQLHRHLFGLASRAKEVHGLHHAQLAQPLLRGDTQTIHDQPLQGSGPDIKEFAQVGYPPTGLVDDPSDVEGPSPSGFVEPPEPVLKMDSPVGELDFQNRTESWTTRLPTMNRRDW